MLRLETVINGVHLQLVQSCAAPLILIERCRFIQKKKKNLTPQLFVKLHKGLSMPVIMAASALVVLEAVKSNASLGSTKASIVRVANIHKLY